MFSGEVKMAADTLSGGNHSRRLSRVSVKCGISQAGALFNRLLYTKSMNSTLHIHKYHYIQSPSLSISLLLSSLPLTVSCFLLSARRRWLSWVWGSLGHSPQQQRWGCQPPSCGCNPWRVGCHSWHVDHPNWSHDNHMTKEEIFHVYVPSPVLQDTCSASVHVLLLYNIYITCTLYIQIHNYYTWYIVYMYLIYIVYMYMIMYIHNMYKCTQFTYM